MPCPRDKELETSRRQLRDPVAISPTTGLLDGTADFFDGVLIKVLYDIKAGDHLIVLKGFHHPLSEEENWLEHVNGFCANPCVNCVNLAGDIVFFTGDVVFFLFLSLVFVDEAI